MDKILEEIRKYVYKEQFDVAFDLLYPYQSDSEILLILADIFEDISPEVRKKISFNNVYEIVLKAAIKGNPKAMVRLADMYRKGNRYCLQNEIKAFEWYNKSYEKGYSAALDSIIECYLYGIGVEADKEKAQQLKKERN